MGLYATFVNMQTELGQENLRNRMTLPFSSILLVFLFMRH